jgi:hypothetical protein
MAEFLREASIRLGISQDRLVTALRASQALSTDELEVVMVLVQLARAGVSLQERSALSRGIVNAIKTVQEANRDPLADVDDSMDSTEAAEELSLAEAEAQTNREAILRNCVSAGEAARRTERSRQTIERLRRSDRLLALRVGNQWRYPAWQFEPDAPGGVVPGLEQVLRNLALSPAGAAFWLLRPAEQLGGSSPFEVLRRHQPEPVIQLAREQGLLP